MSSRRWTPGLLRATRRGDRPSAGKFHLHAMIVRSKPTGFLFRVTD